MDLGLGNLTQLKAYLLPEAMRTGTASDTLITAIGKGVAAGFDRRCGRSFARVTNATETFRGDRPYVFLSRIPVESIASIEQQDPGSSSWDSLELNTIQAKNLDTGHLHFGGNPGIYGSLLRITFTGGYWYDTTENGTGVKPATATALPDDMTLAWLLQCQAVWDARDKLGQQVVKDPNRGSTIAVNFTPQVEELLRPFKRVADI